MVNNFYIVCILIVGTHKDDDDDDGGGTLNNGASVMKRVIANCSVCSHDDHRTALSDCRRSDQVSRLES